MKKPRSGFTLVEVLVAASITAVVGMLLVAIFTQTGQLFVSQSQKISQGLGLNDAIGEITDDLSNTASISLSYPSPSPLFTTSGTTIIFTVPSIDASGNIIANTFDHFVYTQDPSQPNILRKYIYKNAVSNRQDQNSVLLTDLSSLQFEYLDDNKVATTPVNAKWVNVIINLSSSGLNPENSTARAQARLKNI